MITFDNRRTSKSRNVLQDLYNPIYLNYLRSIFPNTWGRLQPFQRIRRKHDNRRFTIFLTNLCLLERKGRSLLIRVSKNKAPRSKTQRVLVILQKTDKALGKSRISTVANLNKITTDKYLNHMIENGLLIPFKKDDRVTFKRTSLGIKALEAYKNLQNLLSFPEAKL